MARDIKLHENGYQIYEKWIDMSEKEVQSLRSYAIRKGRPIFNSGKDKRRIQVNFPKRNRLLDRVLKKWKSRNLIPADPVLIYSKDDCPAQKAHTDYIIDDKILSESEVPLLFLLALESETKLDIWPRSHLLLRGEDMIIKRVTIKLNKGDLLIFRGDLIHAGSAYSHSNIRFHLYLDHPYFPRKKNRTWMVEKEASEFVKDRICV